MNKVKIAVLCFLASAFSACGQKNSNNQTITTSVDSVSYGIGVSIGENLKKDGLNDVNVDLMARGIAEALKGEKTALTMEQIQSCIGAYMAEKQKVKDAENKVKAEANLEKGKNSSKRTANVKG